MDNITNNINPDLITTSQEEASEDLKLVKKEHLKAQINYIKHGKTLIHKLLVIFLGFQALYGMYESILFILVGKKQIEENIINHSFSALDMNQVLGKAVLIIISSSLSLFFAIKISFLKTKIAQNLQIIITLVLIIANTFLMTHLAELAILDQVLNIFNIK